MTAFEHVTEEMMVLPWSRGTKVYARVIFFRIGEIDTLNEKYQAQLFLSKHGGLSISTLITAHLSVDDQRRLADVKSITLLEYALSDLKEQRR